MPTTLTLKNIPDEIYALLRASADAHRRSLNSEAIVCLESALRTAQTPAEERLARAQALRAQLGDARFAVREIDALKRSGRR